MHDAPFYSRSSSSCRGYWAYELCLFEHALQVPCPPPAAAMHAGVVFAAPCATTRPRRRNSSPMIYLLPTDCNQFHLIYPPLSYTRPMECKCCKVSGAFSTIGAVGGVCFINASFGRAWRCKFVLTNPVPVVADLGPMTLPLAFFGERIRVHGQ